MGYENNNAQTASNFFLTINHQKSSLKIGELWLGDWAADICKKISQESINAVETDEMFVD